MATGRRSAMPLVVAALIGLLLVLGVRVLVSSDDQSGGTAAGGSDPNAGPVAVPDGCMSLAVSASSEKAALLGQLAATYNDQRHEAGGQCVWVTVTSKASGAAATALASGWDQTRDGPQPDVWTPASTSWAVLVDQQATEQDRPSPMPADQPSLAQTPLVIAMPQPMAQALGWPDKAIGWADVAEVARSSKGWASQGHPEWGRFKLGKTNPHFSTSGLNATIAAYFAATGVSSDLTVKQVDDPKTRAFVQQLESSVVHYGDTTLTFLENMTNAAAEGQGLAYVSAVTVEEKSVLDYNRGNPSGDPATLGDRPAPGVPLAAIYPSDGTLVSDNPWLVLDADWVTAQKREAAAGLLAWLREPDQQKPFLEAGFRTFEGKAGEVHTPANGLLPAGPSVVLSPPPPKVLDAIQRSWDELRKRAHVLLVIDVSGSMSAGVPGATDTKLGLAQQAAIGAVDGFAGDDEVGLWEFATQRGDNGEPWQSLVPITLGNQAIPAIKAAVDDLYAEGGTALYATLREAQRQMLAGMDTTRINAIVLLSDGKNEYPPDDDLNSLLDQLHGESADTSVRVFPIGYGEGADAEALHAIADASRGAYYEATDPTSIDKVLASVLSNF